MCKNKKVTFFTLTYLKNYLNKFHIFPVCSKLHMDPCFNRKRRTVRNCTNKIKDFFFYACIPFFWSVLPGSWKGTRAKLYSGLFGRLRDVSKILEAPSMTWTRSSYMEPVTSKTNARVDAPSGMSSFLARVPESCAAEKATDNKIKSHISSKVKESFSGRVLVQLVFASVTLRASVDIKAETSERFMKCRVSQSGTQDSFSAPLWFLQLLRDLWATLPVPAALALSLTEMQSQDPSSALTYKDHL